VARQPTVSIVGIRALASELKRDGHDLAQAFAQVGIAPQLLDDDEARVSGSSVLEFSALCMRETGDDDFGLHCAEQSGLGTLDVIDYVLTSSANLGDGLQKFARFQRVLTELAPISLIVDEETARIRRKMPQHPGCRVLSDLFLGLMLLRGRRGTGHAFVPVETCFQYSRPERLDEHERLFGSQLRFDHWETELALSREVLDYPMLRADSGLSHVLDRYAAELAARRPSVPSTAHEVREKLAQHMTGNDLSLQAVARRMSMSPRTLQRRLAEERIAYGQIVEEVRREMSERYLARPELSLTEIAFLLGFSDVSSFHRAFKRWSGQTPAQFREQMKR